MADTFDPHVVAIDVGALSNATRPLFRIPSAGGAVSVLGGHVVTGGTASSSLRLVKGTVSGGTFTVNGTIDSAAVGGTAAPFVIGIIQSWTIATSKVSGGEWVALAEGNVQACPTVTIVSVEYVLGI